MASLIPRPLPDFILPSRGEPIFLEGGDINLRVAWGLATNYAPYEEVMKTLRHCLETSLHGKCTNTEEES